MSGRLLISLMSGLLIVAAARSEERATVKHPNYLLNTQEIEQIKARIKQHDWAAQLFARVKSLADEPGRTGRNPREAALVYALTGDIRYARQVRDSLLGHCRRLLPLYEKLDLKQNPDFGAWGPFTTYAYAYDLTYNTFSDEERKQVEKLLRTAARTIIEGQKLRTTDPDLVFGKHFEVGLIGYCLGDRELIEWGLNDPGHHGPAFGGFYQVLDTNVQDRFFWSEAPRYALGRSLQGMLALAEAARHQGTDLYHYSSKKSGASIKGLIDGYLRLAYSLEKTGIGKGRLLYPDLELITYEPTWLNWTHEGIAHNTLLVDRQSPRPGPVTTRHDFTPEAKFFAVSGSAFVDVQQTRALLLTPDYLADIFRAADTRGRERTFDWVLHGLGRLYPGNPAAYRPTQALLPSYWWVENERGRTTGTAWQADWVQRSAGVTPGLQPFGKDWFAQTVGVRLTMLGVLETEVYTGDGPMICS